MRMMVIYQGLMVGVENNLRPRRHASVPADTPPKGRFPKNPANLVLSNESPGKSLEFFLCEQGIEDFFDEFLVLGGGGRLHGTF